MSRKKQSLSIDDPNYLLTHTHNTQMINLENVMNKYTFQGVVTSFRIVSSDQPIAAIKDFPESLVHNYYEKADLQNPTKVLDIRMERTLVTPSLGSKVFSGKKLTFIFGGIVIVVGVLTTAKIFHRLKTQEVRVSHNNALIISLGLSVILIGGSIIFVSSELFKTEVIESYHINGREFGGEEDICRSIPAKPRGIKKEKDIPRLPEN